MRVGECGVCVCQCGVSACGRLCECVLVCVCGRQFVCACVQYMCARAFVG